ncbi:hypothetical protein ACH5RR_033478 [Cinchona calisaya]|uniref:F-box domain-containing protein n=1 Tax=Cinchona calisaya TaxID=153742 RepID=A0ABD2YMF3_9GENT
MSDYLPYLPQELITEILLRLPAKSVAKFRCVSKPWCSLLTSPHFIKSHLALQKSHDPENLILVSYYDHTLHTITLRPPTSSGSNQQDAVSRQISLLGCQEKWDSVIGSCHGLVLLETEDDNKFLINPTTLEIVEIPRFSSPVYPSVGGSMHGFGHDVLSDDYKIVTISYSYDFCFEQVTLCDYNYVDVYSVKKGTWRRIGNFPFEHGVAYPASGVFLNGVIHWMACEDFTECGGRTSLIAGFYLDHEVFKVIPPPSCLDKSNLVFIKLVVLGGCLGMFVRCSDDQLDVWVMKEYGVQESWTKFSINVVDEVDWFIPICLLRDEEIVLENGEKLITYNLKERTSKDMVVTDAPELFVDGTLPCTESLLSPSFYNHDEDQQIPEV